jgi:hypothetical protein
MCATRITGLLLRGFSEAHEGGARGGSDVGALNQQQVEIPQQSSQLARHLLVTAEQN